MELYFFITGVINSILLTVIFILRKKRLDIIQRYGWLYLFMAVPAIGGLILFVITKASPQYPFCLGVFFLFLVWEWVFDWDRKIDFRKNWLLLTPYLILYYAMNYGFVVLPWRYSPAWGIVMFVLFIIQIAANFWSETLWKRTG